MKPVSIQTTTLNKDIRTEAVKYLVKDDYYLALVDTKMKEEFWDNTEKTVISLFPDNMNSFVNVEIKLLIIDLYPETYEDILEDIRKIDFETCIFLFDRNYINIDKLTSQLVTECDHVVLYDPRILLYSFTLDDIKETNNLHYHTGIPYKKEFSRYKSFNLYGYKNSKNYLTATDKEYYKFKESKFYLLKELKSENKKNSIIRNKLLEYHKELKTFLNKARVNCLQTILTETTDQVFILRKDLSVQFEKFCDNYNVHNSEQALANFKYSLIDVVTSDNVKKINEYTDLVVIADLNTSTIADVDYILNNNDCLIVIPYFINTRDELFINQIKNKFSYLNITNYEEYEQTRIND